MASSGSDTGMQASPRDRPASPGQSSRRGRSRSASPPRRRDESSRERRSRSPRRLGRPGPPPRRRSPPPPVDPVRVRRQVEFYFSDENLATDKHMLGRTGGYRNHEVPIMEIRQFAQMRRFEPHAAVVSALRGSEHLLVLPQTAGGRPEGKEAVVRKTPLPKWYSTEDTVHNSMVLMMRSAGRVVMADGFDPGLRNPLWNIADFFSAYGEVRRVRLEKDRDQEFMGSAIIIFGSWQVAERVAELDPKPKMGEREITISMG